MNKKYISPCASGSVVNFLATSVQQQLHENDQILSLLQNGNSKAINFTTSV